MCPKSKILWFSIAAAVTTPVVAQISSHAETPEISCEQIRAEIRGHVGIPATPNTNLLHKLSGRTECKFSTEEAYRAAFGDRPKRVGEVVHPHSRQYEVEDD